MKHPKTPAIEFRMSVSKEAGRQVGRPCFYCGDPMEVSRHETRPTRDHVHPRKHGGRVTVWACYKCNQMKGHMLLDDFLKRCWKIAKMTHKRELMKIRLEDNLE